MADTDEKLGLKPVADGRIARARALAKMLDSAARLPGTNIRFGLDSILGLIPGVGDATGALFSGYLILLGTRMGVPKEVITRMVMNVVVDTVVGGIPVLGDLFDIGWKSNMRNLKLLEQSVDPVYEKQPVNWALIIAALALMLLVVVGGVWLAIIALKALFWN
ncbi:MAG TPA: DUF4112 domain-containing protein [Gemmatimonadaceae bacterium]|nr:DUF4112 domain-containing protein [Gemmatimonadaceae bacterium]